MIRNYLTVALRNLLRQPVYSLINIVGLAIGMAACMLIVLYIQDELSYDRYHPDADRIYRIVDDIESGGQTIRTAGSPLSWAPALKQDYPEVERFVRMRGTASSWLFHREEMQFYEKKVIWAEDGLFDLFAIPLVAGDPNTALVEPFTIVISETMAAKYFGGEEAMGQILGVDNTYDFKVTGIMRDLPANTHMRADMFTSYSSLATIGSYYRVNWEVHDNFYTYIRLRENADPDDLEARFPDFLEKYAGEKYRESGVVLRPSLQPVVDIHLHSHRESEFEPNGDIRFVVLYTLIAFLIPLIACINFVNLATARSAMRAREVGVRKAMGANRTQLLGQFMGEAVVMAAIAMVISSILVQLALPAVNAITGKQLIFPLSNGLLLAALAFGAIVIGLAAGSYPAVYLSGFAPTEVLKGNLETGTRGLNLRKVLVVVQFAMSIFLLVSTAIIYDQLEYISTKRLGFNKEQVMVLPITGSTQRRNTPVLKERLSQLPGVLGVATASGVPGMRVIPIMAVRPDGMAPEDHLMMATLQVDESFLDVLEIDLAAGRNFSTDWGTDSTTGFLLNEAAVRYLGWGTPPEAIGKPFAWLPFGGKKGNVIGVVEDFHLRTIHEEIEPIVVLTSSYHIYVLIRLEPGRIPETISRIGEAWRNVDAGFPLEYTFLDEDFDRLYQDDRRLGEVFAIFAVLGVFVACLGLLGLASFSIQQRTREIGIRKLLGSSVSTIVVLLSKDFMKYVLLGNVIAWPLAYFVMMRWLQNYAYAETLDFMWFLAGGVAALVIAWLTIGAHAVAASRRNPVNALRQG
ncbi:MAG: FtsX-like permease family protein [Gemmatimonadetes bacterium]|nr:FtsX-like permease family protein [Gemmatimonadota bacterium]MYG83953.1 FtsX-like permease family protein [Gemmatimonadota bacterium]MYJ91141.1 FtsX-like permease family protein [Gemmatimonadota bacterium]